MFKFGHSLIAFLSISLLLNTSAIAGTVSLDSSFNGSGYRVQSISSLGSIGESVAIQPDGKILLGGWTQSSAVWGSFAIMRVNTNGSMDTGFDSDGFAITTVANFNRGDTVRIQPDGKVLLAGNRYFGSTNNDFTVIRYNVNGSLDNSFDGNGVAAPNTSGVWDDYAYDMELQPDGKLVLVGNTSPVSTIGESLPTDITVMRLTTAGGLDTSFNGSGFIRIVFNGVNESANAVAIQPDGKIVIGGFLNNAIKDEFLVMRLEPNGALDTTFGTGGMTFHSVSGGNDRIQSLILQPDGKILAAGGSFITRYSANGVLDNSFGQNGVVTAPHSIRQIILQNDGRILAGGGSVSVSRFNANGTIDATFNQTGTVSATAPGSFCSGRSLAQKDASIIVGGNCDALGTPQFAVFRFVEQSVRKTPFDFDGDAKTDIGIFRPSVGEWWLNRSSTGATVAAQFGASADKPVPADFTGDGKADIAFFRPSTGEWFILRSEDSSFLSFPFGASGDVPLTGDFDADGKADPTVFRPSTGEWFVARSSAGTLIATFGGAGDFPVPRDFDGDGKTDIAIYRPAVGEWWINRSSNSTTYAFQFGSATDKAVPADFTGDGKADAAFFRPSNGNWFILRSEDSSFFSFPFGAAGDLAVPGDYDGDGKTDPAVFRPSDSTWYINRTTAGTLIAAFGATGDAPIPNSVVGP